MSTPKYDRFIEPLVRVLGARPEGRDASVAQEEVADALKLRPEDRTTTMPALGHALYKHRARWAFEHLRWAGLAIAPRRGWWQLTDAGNAMLRGPAPIAIDDVLRLAMVGRDRSRGSTSQRLDAPRESPEERVETALLGVRARVAHELMERVAEATPAFFERLIVELLTAMGYSLKRAEVEVVATSDETGVDLVVALDRLGLETVFVQAKRRKTAVGRSDILAFQKSVELQGTRRGVFITTASLSPEAHAAATLGAGVMVLIDGGRLAALLIDHGVGVQRRTISVPQLDEARFDEG